MDSKKDNKTLRQIVRKTIRQKDIMTDSEKDNNTERQ